MLCEKKACSKKLSFCSDEKPRVNIMTGTSTCVLTSAVCVCCMLCVKLEAHSMKYKGVLVVLQDKGSLGRKKMYHQKTHF